MDTKMRLKTHCKALLRGVTETCTNQGGLMDIYRKEALQHLESPEQLDTMMQVTEPRQWVALAGLCLFLLVFVIWGTVSRVPVLVALRLSMRRARGNWSNWICKRGNRFN